MHHYALLVRNRLRRDVRKAVRAGAGDGALYARGARTPAGSPTAGRSLSHIHHQNVERDQTNGLREENSTSGGVARW